MGLCQDQVSNIYVADDDNQRVQVLGPDLTFKKEFKCQGRPFGVAVDSHGSVHIATTSGMEIFGSELKYGNGHYGDAAISPEGYRFVTCHSTNGGLEIRKPDNSLLGTVSGLRRPFGVCLGQSGYIFIAEWDANKVHKY